jgi:hypothetical protein
MMGGMSKRDVAMGIVENIDRARALVLDFEVGLRGGARLLDEFESMRIECDRVLRDASLRVAELAEG